MNRLLAVCSCAVLTLICSAQDRSGLTELLTFEKQPSLGPGAWFAYPPKDASIDDKIYHAGGHSIRIERQADSDGQFSGVNYALPVDFGGTTIVLKGFVRMENVSDFAALWMREDGESRDQFGLAFDSMQKLHIGGTHDWTGYSISLPVHADAKQLYIGFLLSGTGKAWADDLQVLVDGKPVWEAPKAQRPKTIINTDTEFDNGSGISIAELSKVQIENLAALGKVWGFLKYHHPPLPRASATGTTISSAYFQRFSARRTARRLT